MDEAKFDELVQRLQLARSRRDAIRNAAASALGMSALGAAASDAGAESGKSSKGKGKGKAAKGKHAAKAKHADKAKHAGKKGKKGKDHGVEAEGPCGNGSREDNICTKDSECCTGICQVDAAKKNKDKKGRCRCLRMGAACTADNNCCNSPCVGGFCGALS